MSIETDLHDREANAFAALSQKPAPTLSDLTKAWDRATREWSRDDASDNLILMKKGEAMLFAAIDLISELEAQIEGQR